MKTLTLSEILDKHVGITILVPYPNVKDAMQEYAAQQVAAERDRIKDIIAKIDKDEFGFTFHKINLKKLLELIDSL